MKSIATAATSINVPFYGTNLYVVEVNGEPYTPMKPIVDGMGMDWMGQYTKLKQRFSKGIEEISIPTAGGTQKMICLALRKLSAWLNTISPNKVRMEIRERVIQYQNECDDVLYEYWTKGEVVNPRKTQTSTDDRTPLRDAINMLVGKKGIMYPEAYSYIHQRFNVAHIDELPAEQLPVAIEYVHRLALEGEYIGKQEALPAPSFDFEMYANNAKVAEDHFRFIWQIWREELDPALRKMGSPIPARLIDHLSAIGALTFGLSRGLDKALNKNLLQ